MASKYTDEELTKVGRKAIQQIPYAIRRGLGNESDIEFKNRPGNGQSIADVLPGRRVVYIDKPSEFVANPRQLTAHEMTHMLQSRLHPSVQSRFPATDSKDPYGEMNSPNAGQVLQQARSKGKTISDFSREEQGAIVQRYTALQQGLEDAQKSNTLTPDARDRYQQSLKVYQPFIDDYAKLPMAAMEPTDPDQKGINTKPQAPPGPDPGLLHATEVMPTEPPERIPVPDVPFQDPGPDPSQQGPVSATPPPQTGPQSMGGQIPQQTTPPNPNVVNQQQAPSPQQQDLAHSTALGHGFKSIMNLLGGTRTEYQQTPNGPVPVQKQNNATDFFKNIIAGALVGGAAGGQGTSGSGWQSAARGASAVQQQNQQRQQQAQSQAQQQFENQRAANKDSREAQAQMSEEQLRKAQIAQANMETLKTNQMLQGQSFDLHQKMANADKERIASYTASGLTPVTPEPLSESQMQDYIKNRPGATSLDWRNVGTKTVIGADGQPSYESTFEAYDPKGPITVSPATRSQWEKDGLFEYYPEAKDMLDKKPTIDFNTFNRLDQQAQMYNGQKVAKTLQDQTTKEGQAKINLALAETASHWATAKHENAATAQISEAKNRAAQQASALAHFSAAGGDFTKLDNKGNPIITSGDQLVLREYSKDQAKDDLEAIKENNAQVQLGDKDAIARQADLWNTFRQHSQIGSLAGKSIQRTTAGDPRVTATVAALKGKTPEEIETSLANPQIPDSVKPAIRQALGIKEPPPSKGNPYVEAAKDVGKAVGSVFQSAPTLPSEPIAASN